MTSEGEGHRGKKEKDKSYLVANKSSEHFLKWCKVHKK